MPLMACAIDAGAITLIAFLSPIYAIACSLYFTPPISPALRCRH